LQIHEKEREMVKGFKSDSRVQNMDLPQMAMTLGRLLTFLSASFLLKRRWQQLRLHNIKL
jgi:hypothetical protein